MIAGQVPQMMMIVRTTNLSRLRNSTRKSIGMLKDDNKKERERMGPLLTNPNDPRPWETAGETVKRGGKWGKGKGKANQRPKKRVWNERRKEWLLNLPVCSEPQQSVRGAPRWAIKVKTRCEYLKHLPTHIGDTMERQFVSGDEDLEALIRHWQPRQMRDRNWTSANYYWWRIQKEQKRTPTKLQLVEAFLDPQDFQACFNAH